MNTFEDRKKGFEAIYQKDIMSGSYTTSSTHNSDDTIIGLTNASGFIRGSLGKSLDLRYIPALEFVLDETPKRVAKINKIIDELHSR